MNYLDGDKNSLRKLPDTVHNSGQQQEEMA